MASLEGADLATHEEEQLDVEMDVDEDIIDPGEDEGEDEEEDDDDDFNITLRTPRRPKKKGASEAPDSPTVQTSPPPELRVFRQQSEDEFATDDEEGDFNPQASSTLNVPASRSKRSISNYTLSSVRASRQSSEATSLTTASRASSIRMAPSLSYQRSGASASGASDSGSLAGTKRPRPPVTRRGVVESRPAKRVASRAIGDGTIRAKPSNTRASVVPKVDEASATLPARRRVDVDGAGDSDTLESAEEPSRAVEPFRKRVAAEQAGQIASSGIRNSRAKPVRRRV